MNNKELVDRTMAAIKQGITEGGRDARRRIAELGAENEKLRAALEEVMKDWKFDIGETVETAASWQQAQLALSPRGEGGE